MKKRLLFYVRFTATLLLYKYESLKTNNRSSQPELFSNNAYINIIIMVMIIIMIIIIIIIIKMMMMINVYFLFVSNKAKGQISKWK